MNAHKFPLGRSHTAPVSAPTAAVPAHPLTGAAAPTFTDDCPECEGRGLFDGGDFHPDDPRWGVSWECDNCSGTGEVEIEPTCQCGSAIDANGFCADCDDVAETGWALAEASAERSALLMPGSSGR